MVRNRDIMPKVNDTDLLNFLTNLKPMAIPMIVENSAIPFIAELTKSPLRARIASIATMDVVALGSKPYNKKDSTIGTPVKSNLRKGSHGKGIFKPENFKL